MRASLILTMATTMAVLGCERTVHIVGMQATDAAVPYRASDGSPGQPPAPPAPPVGCDQACATRARDAFTACTQTQGADQTACRTSYASALALCGCPAPSSAPLPPSPPAGS